MMQAIPADSILKRAVAGERDRMRCEWLRRSLQQILPATLAFDLSAAVFRK
jgi:hypothetical protein